MKIITWIVKFENPYKDEQISFENHYLDVRWMFVGCSLCDSARRLIKGVAEALGCLKVSQKLSLARLNSVALCVLLC